MNKVNSFCPGGYIFLCLIAVACSNPSGMNDSIADHHFIFLDSPDVSIESNEDFDQNTTTRNHDLDTTFWTDMSLVLKYAKFDILYATASNFTGRKIYDCGRCFLRRPLGERLQKVEEYLFPLGIGLMIYDCYRPAPYQQILWDSKPDPRYVMPPSKGSNHSRGVSVDVGLYYIDNGRLLDMGTPVDFLGKASHWDYMELSPDALNNRLILRNAMESQGFNTISTEWWHFDLTEFLHYSLSSDLWSCP
jgi:zinc D-Ala-D-Ala dipeptidase